MPHLAPNRREFLLGLAAGLATTPLLKRGIAAVAESNPLYRISLAEWSLHKAINAKQLSNLDFARIAREEFDIDGIEYVSTFFEGKVGEQSYLADLKKRSEQHGVRNVLIMVDREGALGDPDAARRRQAVENHRKWLEAAAYLGCHSIRVNAQSKGTYDEQMRLASDGLRELTLLAEPLNLNVIVENHGGLSSNGRWLAEVMRQVDHPHCGTLPDFGNFRVSPTEFYDRYEGVEELMPFAKGVSAKSYDFNGEGNETSVNYLRMMKLVLDSGYRGFVGIEYEGSDLSEFDGIRKTKALLERVRTELAKNNG
ncbi:sugar phosphate isomerase/epimerase family protein [Planctomicrobium sp. SH664]|uniref:sugar phosphate isomerase/epimerase family protein n=1 Tax=Planctomicrobium sp. SH664 TaxID=3448125 RepID=UPI003F5CBA51